MEAPASEEFPAMLVEAGDVIQVGQGPLKLQVRTSPATVQVVGPVAKTTIEVIAGEVFVDIGPGDEPVVTIKTAGQGASLNIEALNGRGGRSSMRGINVGPGSTTTVGRGGSMIVSGGAVTLNDFNVPNINFPGFFNGFM